MTLSRFKNWRFIVKEDAPLPQCGYSPSEMITHVGDALLTLPQHLDPIQGKDKQR